MTKTHCASCIVVYMSPLTVLTSWKMAASSVLTVNEGGEASFVSVFVPNRESCCQQNGKSYIYMCERNCEYFLSVFFKRSKCRKSLCFPSPTLVSRDEYFQKIRGNGGEREELHIYFNSP